MKTTDSERDECDARESAQQHGPEWAGYNNLPYQHPTIRCLCGFWVEGDNWEECGAEFDAHLDGKEKP